MSVIKRWNLLLREAVLAAAIIILLAGCAGDGHDMSEGHGEVDFQISCNEQARVEFETGLAHLHHMMYEQARPRFEAAVEADANCGMAYWGVAMTRFHPLWMPTPDDLIEQGQNALARAREAGVDTAREEAYIRSAEAYFRDPMPKPESPAADHAARLEAWMNTKAELYEAYPEDVDAAAFYSLSQVSHATAQFSPGQERDYSLQIEAGERLERFFGEYPNHPGLFHYIIHAYDSPQLADRATEAAAGYDQLAPDTPHALHMPSHIFVRLGRWEETIDWNERSAESALRQARVDGHAKLHYVHALDYKMYAQLQLGQLDRASKTLEKVRSVEYLPLDFISAYGAAAPQARYFLEQGLWEEAAELEVGVPEVIDWESVPAATALFHYARGIGAARVGDLVQAREEQELLEEAVSRLRRDGNHYWAYMTEALAGAVDAWILYREGGVEEALANLKAAAELEESMDKHPVTPGEVLPVRELYGEMLLIEGMAEKAIEAFELSLERTPNRAFALAGIEKAHSLGGR